MLKSSVFVSFEKDLFFKCEFMKSVIIGQMQKYFFDLIIFLKLKTLFLYIFPNSGKRSEKNYEKTSFTQYTSVSDFSLLKFYRF